MNAPVTKLIGTVELAEVRSELAADQLHSVPVLFIELRDVGPGRHVVHARHPYTEQTRRDAEGWAARLTKGTRLVVAAPLRNLHLSVPHADFAIATPDDEEELQS
jgi:hypothetical protein